MLSNLLAFLVELLPQDNEMPSTTYESKKTLKLLGMNYKKIYVCPNDCILYRKEFENESKCPVCQESRWKKKRDSEDEVIEGIPAKVPWYIPLSPRFICLF